MDSATVAMCGMLATQNMTYWITASPVCRLMTSAYDITITHQSACELWCKPAHAFNDLTRLHKVQASNKIDAKHSVHMTK